MAHYYKAIEDMNDAEKLVDDLEKQGIDRNKINIIVKQDYDVDVSEEALKDTDTEIEDAPEGTVSTFGVVFTPLAAVTAGVLLAGAGPIAAAVGGGAVAAGGTALLMSGLGIPRESEKDVLDRLESGHILVHVEDDADKNIEGVFDRYH